MKTKYGPEIDGARLGQVMEDLLFLVHKYNGVMSIVCANIDGTLGYEAGIRTHSHSLSYGGDTLESAVSLLTESAWVKLEEEGE